MHDRGVGSNDDRTRGSHIRVISALLPIAPSRSECEDAPRTDQAITRRVMADTTCHMSISLDGFVAGPDQSREDPLGKRGRELHG